jgi:checkpoint serine/threonine-protein kinase
MDEHPKQTFVTPDIGRRALTTKDSTPAASLKPPTTLKATSEENPGRENENINVKANVFSRVFTPVSQKEPLTRPTSQGAKTSPLSENAGVFQPPAPKPDTAPFAPFDSKTPFKVFTRPPSMEGGENAGHVFTPKPSAFRPFADSGTVAASENQVGRRAPLESKPPASETYTDESSEPADDPQQNLSSSDEPFEDGYGEAEDRGDVPLSSSSSVSDQFEEEYEEAEPPQPLGGRFGKINVMTPITERTFEFSTRGLPTPR